MSIKVDELDQCAYANNRTIKPIRKLKFYYRNNTGEELGPSANDGHGFDMGLTWVHPRTLDMRRVREVYLTTIMSVNGMQW